MNHGSGKQFSIVPMFPMHRQACILTARPMIDSKLRMWIRSSTRKADPIFYKKRIRSSTRKADPIFNKKSGSDLLQEKWIRSSTRKPDLIFYKKSGSNLLQENRIRSLTRKADPLFVCRPLCPYIAVVWTFCPFYGML